MLHKRIRFEQLGLETLSQWLPVESENGPTPSLWVSRDPKALIDVGSLTGR